jgi:hypothetical protein
VYSEKEHDTTTRYVDSAIVGHGPSRLRRHPRPHAPLHATRQRPRANVFSATPTTRCTATSSVSTAGRPTSRCGVVPDAKPCSLDPGAVRRRRVTAGACGRAPPLRWRDSRAAKTHWAFLAGAFRRGGDGRSAFRGCAALGGAQSGAGARVLAAPALRVRKGRARKPSS